jgi:ABC-type amino acid transport substrate-binding protein
MRRRIRVLVPVALLLLGIATANAQAPAAAAAPAHTAATADIARRLAMTNKPFTGDFNAMLERRIIRVYAPYSRSLYFIDKGRERGLGAELVRDFERWVNQKYAKQLGKRPVTVYIVAATRDKLLGDLKNGLADIAVGNLTVTDERQKVVDFVAPDDKIVNVEIVVTGPASPAVTSVDDLSGKTLHVRKASSYYQSVAPSTSDSGPPASRGSTSCSCPTRSRTRTCSR